jgi:hypothetical protein
MIPQGFGDLRTDEKLRAIRDNMRSAATFANSIGGPADGLASSLAELRSQLQRPAKQVDDLERAHRPTNALERYRPLHRPRMESSLRFKA